MYLYPFIDWDKTIVSPSYVRFTELTVHGPFWFVRLKNWHSSYIVAHWLGNDGNISSHADLGLNPRPGVIKFFIKHVLVNVDSKLVHWFAYCQWFKLVEEDISQNMENQSKCGNKNCMSSLVRHRSFLYHMSRQNVKT